MQEHQTIFSIKELKKKVNAFYAEIRNKEDKLKIIQNWQANIISGKVLSAKEEELKQIFLSLLFGDILEYEYKNPTNWNLRFENKTDLDSQKADAALGFFKIEDGKEIEKDVRVVIEIKNARTTLDKPQNRKDFKGSAVEQAFMYAAKSGEKCKWIIVSNFLEIRLYQANDMTKYESFDMLSLNNIYEFQRFCFLLSKGQLFLNKLNSSVDKLLADRYEKEKTITKEFYNKYQNLREKFLHHLKLHNKEKNPLELLQYAQTIIDRLIFIKVAFDYDLVSYNPIDKVVKVAEESFAYDNQEIWRQIKNLFVAFDKGFEKGSRKILNKFNGGLFRQNPDIENLIIKDIFLNDLLELNTYDFESDLSINVLGHIFEQSVTDLEILKNEILNDSIFEYTETDEEIIYTSPLIENNRRKKEGIYYTPEAISDFIISNSVGQWLENQKEIIGINQLTEFPETDDEKQYSIELWEKYQSKLSEIKILDPACGSGAFITQTFDFLLKEWKIITDILEKLKGKKFEIKQNGVFSNALNNNDKRLYQIKKHIVNNNLYGVDLNYESVEMTKLGLWLKSASKNDELALLDTNIKHGNSLIEDKSITDNAFNWHENFSEIMKTGGFDVIVGNPPYVSANNMDFNQRQYFNQNKDFKTLTGKWDLFIPFIEKSLKLLNNNGYFSFIVPYAFLNQPFGEVLRKYILNDFSLHSIVDLHDAKIFEQATVPTCIPTISKTEKKSQKVKIIQLADNIFYTSHTTEIEVFKKTEMTMFRTERLDEVGILLNKMKQKGVPLGEFFYVSTGAEIHGKEKRTETGELISGSSKFDVLHSEQQFGFKPYIEGSDIPKSREIGRYCYPKITQYLDYDNNFERMRSPKYKELFESEKIIIRRSSGLLNILSTLDERNIYTSEKCILIISKTDLLQEHSDFSETKQLSLKYLLGIINSKLMNSYYSSVYGGFIDVYPNYLKALPIPTNISEELQKNIENHVTEILELHKKVSEQTDIFQKVVISTFGIQKATQKLIEWYNLEWSEFVAEIKKSKGKILKKQEFEFMPHFNEQKQNIQTLMQNIKHIDKEIDNLVYQVYDISNDEIEIIEKYNV